MKSYRIYTKKKNPKKYLVKYSEYFMALLNQKMAEVNITNIQAKLQLELLILHLHPFLSEFIFMSLKWEILPRPAVYSQICITVL